MKKTIALVMALVMTAALLVGCGGQGNAGNSKFETSDTYTLKMHLSVAATDPVYASAEKFVELVEAKTDGKVTFELYPSSSLGVTSDCLEGLSMRACDVVYDSMSNLSTWNELANIEATFVRGNTAGFQMIYLYNPPKNPNAPVNLWCKKMEQRPDCIHIHTDYRDVPVRWLGQDLIDSAEAMKAVDPKMYRWTWLGEPVGVDELIYYMFSDRHRSKPEEGRGYERAYIGGDYGQQNATTYQAFGLYTYRRKFPGLGEYYHSGRESGTQRSPSEYAHDLVTFMEELHERFRIKVFYVCLDPSAKGLQEEIRRATRIGLDYQVLIRDAENDVALGISRVQKAFAFEVLSISPDQENLIGELGIYEYDKKSIEKGKEVPIKENDHACDALRDAVMTAWKQIRHWLPAETEEKVSITDIMRKEVEDENGYFQLFPAARN